ncbi:MAG: glycosyltransferase [Armatimonadota bacterium]|jgi:glycosyltransferase involved in cell wall biosynthesis
MVDEVLTVVVIGRNDGLLLGKCLASIRRAAERMEMEGHAAPRVIYVDGQSVDGSPELARQHCIEVYLVDGPPTAAAGRHCGFERCSSRYVFFVDGDCEVHEGWLGEAVRYLDTHPEPAGVGGLLAWRGVGSAEADGAPNYWGTKRDDEIVRDGVGGCFVYRTKVLRRTGDFDPTVPCGEEFELCLRLAAAGHYLVRIDRPMATHWDAKSCSLWTFASRHLISRRALVPGVIAAQAPRRSDVWRLLWHHHYPCFVHPIVGYPSILLLAWGLLARAWLPIIAGAAGLTLLSAAHLVYKRYQVTRAAFSLVTMTFFSTAFWIGFLTRRPTVGGYYRGKAAADIVPSRPGATAQPNEAAVSHEPQGPGAGEQESGAPTC